MSMYNVISQHSQLQNSTMMCNAQGTIQSKLLLGSIKEYVPFSYDY